MQPAEAITVQQLLTMTSVLPGDPAANDPTFTSSPDWVDFILSYRYLRPADKSFAYSGPGAHLLAAVLTKVTEHAPAVRPENPVRSARHRHIRPAPGRLLWSGDAGMPVRALPGHPTRKASTWATTDSN
jgi:hypothetical protein